MKKRLSILGSTGSIGVNALLVVENLPDDFEVVYLSTNQNAEILIQQAKKFKPKTVAVVNEEAANKVKSALSHTEVLSGRDGLLELAGRDDVDLLRMVWLEAPEWSPRFVALKPVSILPLPTKRVW